MARFKGTNAAETITPLLVSDTVVATPAATKPSDASDFLYGFGGNDTLDGGAGNDVLDGGTGADTMTGGLGSDTYNIDNSGDVIMPEASNGGIDTVSSAVTFTLGVNLENLVLTGKAANGTGNSSDNTIVGNVGNNTLLGLDGNDVLNGSGGNDVLRGGNGNDKLNGGIGNDMLSGGADNDTLEGSTGADTMDGGAGNDTYYVDNLGDKVIDTASSGIDTVISTVSFTLSTQVENLTLFGAALNGTGNAQANKINGTTGNNILVGLGGNDTLNGLAGNDRLDGGEGTDTMNGGLGNDTYIVDDFTDVVIEPVNGGADVVISSDYYRLPANVERLTLAGGERIDGTGNQIDNVITGNDTGNTLLGLEGNDIIYGRNGWDTLNGGFGNDFLYGDVGNDNLVGEDGNDSLDGGAGNDVLNGGVGNDVLSGDDGNDALDGGVGEDKLSGGVGNDTYYIDNLYDTITEPDIGGIDTVVSTLSFTLADQLENLTLTGAANTEGNGNPSANKIIGNSGNNILIGVGGDDVLEGNNGNDALFGGIDDDTLKGGAGDDYLNGGTGADTMFGGPGDDWYYTDNVLDAPVDDFNGGIDKVETNLVYWTLADSNIENLTLTNSSDETVEGHGNNRDNVITYAGHGDALFFVSSLFGEYGDDTLYGGDGNDNLHGGPGNDHLYAGDGGFESLSGNQGDDWLLGGAGCDVLAGGFGSDKFVFQFISDSLANVVPGPITADFIGDFNANEVNEGDVIDLSAIDANPFEPGDQPFLWIGSAAFDADATAQLRYSGGQLYGSVDADADPEFQLGVFAKNRPANLSVGGVASDVIL